MNLLALADFNLVARHGGFGKGACATGPPKATLSRHVTELEATLQLRLFERGARPQADGRKGGRCTSEQPCC